MRPAIRVIPPNPRTPTALKWDNSGVTDHVYRVIEVVGSSSQGADAAITNAVARAAETVRNLEWFEVVDTRGHIVDGAVAHTQVTLKIGFRIEPGEPAS